MERTEDIEMDLDPARVLGAEQPAAWSGVDSPVGEAVRSFSASAIASYKADRRLITEHANIERSAIEGGYARRQLYELVQNGADELINQRGRIALVLTDAALYCANEGSPVSEQGVGALLGSFNSAKSGVEIGRFGLGFKSVLGVSTTPEVYSRTGSFGFDQASNLDAVKRLKPDTERAATLRIARPLDPAAAAADDDDLRQLMTWATTVIKVPRNVGDTSWLQANFAKPGPSRTREMFPAEFLLFCSHVSSLSLEDKTTKVSRQITLSRNDKAWDLVDSGTAGKTDRWRVFEHVHTPTAAVKQDGGTTGDRAVLPIHWAAPTNASPGTLWAFFPTSELTSLSGILNAPWKMNEDRTRLVEGPFNRELLVQASALVVRSLAGVKPENDPGKVLELLPGRLKESRGWADEIIVSEVWKAAERSPSIPDQTGALRLPGSLRYAPESEVVPIEAIELWSQQRGRPMDWVHPSAYRNSTRKGRVVRFREGKAVDKQPVAIKDWLETLAREIEDPLQGSAAAIRVAALIAARPGGRQQLETAKIVLTATSRLVAPRSDQLFLPNEDEAPVDVELIHPDLLALDGVRDALADLQIRDVTAETVLDGAVQRALLSPGPDQWEMIWRRARGVATSAKVRIFERAGAIAADVYVLSAGGSWRRLSELLVPGELLELSDVDVNYLDLLVDMTRHGDDWTLFERLGARGRPAGTGGSRDEPWLRQYERDVIDEAVQAVRSSGGRAKPGDFTLAESGPWAGPAGLLDGLTDSAAAKYAQELLTGTPDLAPWSLRGKGGERHHQPVEHPLLRRVRELGRIQTSDGAQPIRDCVSPLLKGFSGLLPVPSLPVQICHALGVPKTTEELGDHHLELALQNALRLDREEKLGEAYLLLSGLGGKAPKELRALKNRRAAMEIASKVCVAVSKEDVRVLRETGTPYVRLQTEAAAQRLIAAWGLVSVADAVESKLVAVRASEPEPVGDAYPYLRDLLTSRIDSVSFVACSELRRELFTSTGTVTDELDFQMDGDLAYHLAEMDDRERIRRIADALREPLSAHELESVLDDKAREDVLAFREMVRERTTPAEKLLALVPAAVLRTRLPQTLNTVFEETEELLTDVDLAELYLTVHDARTLESLKDELRDRGHNPPSSWAGKRVAVDFVKSFGFDPSFAGTRGETRSDVLDALGPVNLPALHDFQELASIAIRDMVQRPKNERRGFLSLPTGAGKTRVAVQSLVEAMVAHERPLPPPVLWIAQQDELCEQAVQSWAEVWRSVGRPSSSLRISRLWAGQTAKPVDDGGDQVVVATIQTLVNCIEKEQYDWLRYAGCVVIDEAHGSLTGSYDKVLKWLEMDGTDTHAPLLGLSATPFRGYNQAESAALAARYGRNRLDEAAFGDDQLTIEFLQEQEILAKVRHKRVAGSESVPITPDQRKEFEKFKTIPKSLLTKIGEDTERTLRLVDEVLNLDEDWPVIFFAASVEHAETTAALLSRAGRSAAAISGETPMPLRRKLIKRYGQRDIKVLTNCNVLTQGFDAPLTKAVVIARPVYSPNVYQQMVGRALRGPRNGGNAECLVVNVDDNIEVHGTRLAFLDFEYLWK